MNRAPRIHRTAAVVGIAFAVLAATACAPEDEDDASGDDTSVAPEDGETSAADDCAVESLPVKNAGTLTVGTSDPAFPPWIIDNDPTNGEGFESAVAYAVAEQMGFSADQVTWTPVTFEQAYAPGAKDFDFDINQVSITPKRAEAVDFSDGYYDVAQGLVVLKNSGFDAASLADLKDAKIGAQIGTTSATAAQEAIQPNTEIAIFDDTNAAKQALQNGSIDAIVADLDTALYISAVEIPKSTVAGQFATTTDPEQFGLVFEKGNPLVECVNVALAALEADGTLADLEAAWLDESANIPTLE